MTKLISSFELLVKAIAPIPFGIPYEGDRTIIQSFLLLISNLNPSDKPDVSLRLKFTTGGMPLSSNKLLTIFDAGTGNLFGTLDATGKTGDLVLPSGFTGWFLLQPDLRKPSVLPPPPAKPNIEIRGYVEAEISTGSATSNARLMVIPQQRSTFLVGTTPPSLNQDIYCLPNATGGAQIEFP